MQGTRAAATNTPHAVFCHIGRIRNTAKPLRCTSMYAVAIHMQVHCVDFNELQESYMQRQRETSSQNSATRCIKRCPTAPAQPIGFGRTVDQLHRTRRDVLAYKVQAAIARTTSGAHPSHRDGETLRHQRRWTSGLWDRKNGRFGDCRTGNVDQLDASLRDCERLRPPINTVWQAERLADWT